MKDIEEYLSKTPGGLLVILDLLFQEECDPEGKSISSSVGMQLELDRMKDQISKQL